MTFYSNDSKPQLTFSEINMICEKWVKKLQLEDLSIYFNYIEEPFNKEMGRPAFLQWIHEDQEWEICFYQLVDKKTVIHELGHIYLAKILNNWHFVSSWESPKEWSKKINIEIDKFLNRLLDCFVDYNLSKFDDFYSAYISHIDSGLDKYPDPGAYKMNKFLFYYLKAYIDFYFILKPMDISKFISRIEGNLKKVRNTIIIKSKQENRKLHFKRFQNLDKQLDEFNLIKDSLDPKTIVNFFYKTLKILGFWNSKELQYNIKLYFGINIIE